MHCMPALRQAARNTAFDLLPKSRLGGSGGLASSFGAAVAIGAPPLPSPVQPAREDSKDESDCVLLQGQHDADRTGGAPGVCRTQ
jgi:hypothetical protein